MGIQDMPLLRMHAHAWDQPILPGLGPPPHQASLFVDSDLHRLFKLSLSVVNVIYFESPGLIILYTQPRHDTVPHSETVIIVSWRIYSMALNGRRSCQADAASERRQVWITRTRTT
jgi:hypothetical protein